MSTDALLSLIVQKEILARSALVEIQPKKVFDALLSFLLERHPNIAQDEASEEGWSIVWQRLLFAGCLRAREFLQLQQAFFFFLREPPDVERAALHRENVAAIIDAQLSEHLLLQSAVTRLLDANETFAEPLIHHRDERLRAVLRWLSGETSLVEMQQECTQRAEASVVWGWNLAIQEDQEEHGAPLCMALIAFGSLGAHEMIYLSDVDLVFLYDGAHQERCIRVAQRLISLLSSKEGGASSYEIDTRLRPFGTQGPLVSSMEEWARYYEPGESMRAHLWEEQALLRARSLIGDASLLALFERHRAQILSRQREASVVAAELRRMRQRIEHEISKRHLFHYKTSSGGLFDVDFAVQSIQLTHGDKFTAARHIDEVLRAIAAEGALTIEDAKTLLAARGELLRMILWTRLITERSADHLPEAPDALRRLLRALQFSSEELLQMRLEPLRLQVRACFDRIVLRI